ncbi:MAG TPA: type II toxin-antitoxin system VapC family toxin [Gemmatimonadaceae bacterium]|nr:type II toxin-antitoxin system VapC family toxin [Gemmatimonadaceae bacterium]
MNLLLDSHALLWALHDPHRLRRDALEAIQDPANTVFFSAASAWELEIKCARGKLRLPTGWLAAAERTGFVHMAVRAEEARASAHLPWHHADPFDRLLVAQARAHSLTLATRDHEMVPYGVAILEV